MRQAPDATALLAVDHRWLTTNPMDLAGALNALGRPAALCWLTRRTRSAPAMPYRAARRGEVCRDLSLIRTDHGGLGALIYGARHAAIGLVPPTAILSPRTRLAGAGWTTGQHACSCATLWTGLPARQLPAGRRRGSACSATSAAVGASAWTASLTLVTMPRPLPQPCYLVTGCRRSPAGPAGGPAPAVQRDVPEGA